jgi:hypothetical protein
MTSFVVAKEGGETLAYAAACSNVRVCRSNAGRRTIGANIVEPAS